MKPKPLNSPLDGNNRILHLIGNVGITAALSHGFEVVFQQASETPQFTDGCEVGVSGDRPASKSFSSDVFGNRDAGNFCVFEKPLILGRTHTNGA